MALKLFLVMGLFSVGVFACVPVTISCESVPNTALREPLTKLTCEGEKAFAELSTIIGQVEMPMKAYEIVRVHITETEFVYKAVPVERKVMTMLGYPHITTNDANYYSENGLRGVRALYPSNIVSSVFIWEGDAVKGFFTTDNKIHKPVDCTATWN